MIIGLMVLRTERGGAFGEKVRVVGVISDQSFPKIAHLCIGEACEVLCYIAPLDARGVGIR